MTNSDNEGRPVYLDANATTPLEPAVLDEVMHYFIVEFGNSGSRTHEYGQAAKSRVQRAREQVAEVVAAHSDEVVFTSGATESNNIALLGLVEHGEKTGRRRVITTAIEHKAVIEPVEQLARRGFDVVFLPTTAGGWVDPQALADALTPDTLAVSVMQVNNETGVRQPLADIAELLRDHQAYLHVDAAQGFGKELAALRDPRIDLISISGHKIYGPKGVGALVARRRGYKRPPLVPLVHGGGQERGLRPGTLPVPLVAGLGTAAHLAVRDNETRMRTCLEHKSAALRVFDRLGAEYNGDPDRVVAHAVNLSIPGLDSEALILALKGAAAVSNGSACTSHSYEPSHVLIAMGLPVERVQGALRLSWSHLTAEVDWEDLHDRIAAIR
ncbi:cysteine desulfurase DndA [Actinokineospora spheciospongiae]|uniref:cysteine desulfurase DndA n=1 Tax=Actinokineospora spheciospongiae TaxID=909613 RepID=UPI000D872D19|nr:cysteine desulfurase DndA [Actinokineospora spheciospongiae]PWW65620.1 cysteine desulfurase [Actinokineospora spheciospongiae]